MNKTTPTLLLNDSAFVNALRGLQSFVLETGADIDMAYDWLCDQAGINSFCHDCAAFDCFYDVFMDASDAWYL